MPDNIEIFHILLTRNTEPSSLERLGNGDIYFQCNTRDTDKFLVVNRYKNGSYINNELDIITKARSGRVGVLSFLQAR